MIQINIAPKVRFYLYLVGISLGLGVAYAVDKEWAGDAEVRLAAGVSALLNLLAATKTDLSKPSAEQVVAEAGKDAIEGYAPEHRGDPANEGGFASQQFPAWIAGVVFVVAAIAIVLTQR